MIIKNKIHIVIAISCLILYTNSIAQPTTYYSNDNTAGTGGNRNSNFGSYAGSVCTGSANTNIGYDAGWKLTTGYGNTYVGAYAGLSNTNSNLNTMIGMNAGRSLNMSHGNTFIGSNAGEQTVNAHFGYNVFLGYNAGFGFDFNGQGFLPNGGVFILNNQASVARPLLFGTFAVIDDGNRDNPTNTTFLRDPQLGIGTSSLVPGSTLTVGGDVTVNGRLFSNTEFGGIYLDLAKTAFVGNNGDYFGFYSSTPSVQWNALKIRKSTGNVGIGITGEPTSKLSVGGSLRVYATDNPTGPSVKVSHDGYTAAIESDGDQKGLRIESKIGKRIALIGDTITIGTGVAKKGFHLTINGPTFIKYVENSTSPLMNRYQLWVDKGIVGEDFAVGSVADWPDYVFHENYKLPSLTEVSQYISKNRHLEGMPSASQVKESGISLIEINKKLLQKIEELTLYTIEQERNSDDLEIQLDELEKQVKLLIEQQNEGKKPKGVTHEN